MLHVLVCVCVCVLCWDVQPLKKEPQHQPGVSMTIRLLKAFPDSHYSTAASLLSHGFILLS